MWNNTPNVITCPKFTPQWIDSFNVSWYKNFIQSEAGVKNKTGQDILSLNKYDSFNFFIFEQLNKVVIKQYLINKKRKEIKKEDRPKKSLLPFINYGKIKND